MLRVCVQIRQSPADVVEGRRTRRNDADASAAGCEISHALHRMARGYRRRMCEEDTKK